MKAFVFFALAVLLAGCVTQSGERLPVRPTDGASPLATELPTFAPISGGAFPTISTSASPTNPVENQTSGQAEAEENMQRGTADPDFELAVYDKKKALFGTTVFPDNHVPGRPRIVEVNIRGEIVWQYVLPQEWTRFTNPGFDVEPLASGNLLFVLPGKGVFEVNKVGKIAWSYYDEKVSHDADRLSNGNTLISFGNNDQKEDSQVKEVDSSGKIVWYWRAKSAFLKPQFETINDQGWTHTNAVSRLSNGNTLVSLRNFDLLAEVDANGSLVRTIENPEFRAQHDPEVQANGNILLANHATPNQALEIDGQADIVWRFTMAEKKAWPVRDANKLSNGNVLITGSDRIVEVTPDGEVVWALKLKNVEFTKTTASRLGFYKAERLEAK